MIALVLSLAFGGELTEAVFTRGAVEADGKVYTSEEPIYILPTPVFDKLLAAKQQATLCEEGLARTQEHLRDAKTWQEHESAARSQAVDQATRALQMASEQMRKDQEQDQQQAQAVLALEEKLGRAQAQRNVALGITGGVLAALIANAVASR